MEPPTERVFRGSQSSANVERLYPARVARIARGELTYTDKGRINEEVSCIDREWRRGHFNGIEYVAPANGYQCAEERGRAIRLECSV